MKKNILLITLLASFLCIKAQELTVTIDGTIGECYKTTSKNVPVFCANKWAISQQFYTAEEICKEYGTIESIAFKTAEVEDERPKYPFKRNLIIYLVNSEEHAVAGNTMKAMSATDQVFAGEVDFSYNTWVTIDIEDFEYRGKNLLICINDVTGSNVAGGITFDAFIGATMIGESNGYRALYKRSISEAFDATKTITGATTILDTPVPCVQINFKEGTTGEYLNPAQPTNLTATVLNESEVLLTWVGDENTSSYNICENAEIFANITDTSYIVKNLSLGWHCFKIIGVNGVKKSTPSEIECVELVRLPEEPEIGDGDENEEPETPVEPEQPGDEPEQPGDEPEQPGDEPEQPGDEPEQPGDEPEQPGDEPEQPGDEPEQPEEPEQPGDEPEQPEEPEQPGDEPEQPGDEPEQPGDEPEDENEDENEGSGEDENLEAISELTTSLLLYPNPANDKLHIVTEVEIEEVVVYDAFGRQQTTDNGQQTTDIDVAGLNTGVYFVMIKTNDGVVMKRFVKE